MRLGPWLVLLLAPVVAWAAGSPSIEFNGVVVEVANWVVVGGKFEGYTVTAYVPDPKGADAVELRRNVGAQTLRVGLKNAVILVAPAAVDPKMIANLIAVGRGVYAAGYLEGAESTIDQVLKLDPENQEALALARDVAASRWLSQLTASLDMPQTSQAAPTGSAR